MDKQAFPEITEIILLVSHRIGVSRINMDTEAHNHKINRACPDWSLYHKTGQLLT